MVLEQVLAVSQAKALRNVHFSAAAVSKLKCGNAETRKQVSDGTASIIKKLLDSRKNPCDNFFVVK
jgi:hypothetical protein